MDLFADLKRIVEQQLNALGVTFSAGADVQQLMLLALNHELKTVSQQPRRVHRSKEFTAKQAGLEATQQQAVSDILAKFEKGDDVNGHLSKSSAKPAETDALLADWKIHHLHISNHKDKPSDMFFARTGPVMFAHVAPNDVYFIGIYPHGKGYPETWTRQTLLKIIDENWPHLLDHCRIKGTTGLSFNPTDMDLKAVRGAHGNSIVQIGNSFIAPPGGGLAMDGTPSNNVFRMNKTLHLIKELESSVIANAARVKAEIASKSGFSEGELDFELFPSAPGVWAVLETKTQTLVAKRSG